MKNKGLIALVSALFVPALTHASAIYITTGQTGAQTQMDVNHDAVFDGTLSLTCGLTACATGTVAYFDPTFNWDLAGGSFTMKDGSSTSADITFSLFDAWGDLLSSVTYTNSEFCTAHGGNCQNFAQTKFTFSTPVTLVGGQQYYATLTSNAVDAQSTAYFIKGLDSMGFSPNAPIDPDSPPGNDPPPPSTAGVPEPGSIWMMLGGAASIVAFRRRK